MSLAPGEQRTLAAIENELSRTDPRLAGMLSRFADDSRGRSLIPHPSAQRSQVVVITLLAIMSTLVIACAVIAAALIGPASPRHGGQPPGSVPAQIVPPF